MIDLSQMSVPLIIAIAGPNGAGKSTFYRAHLASSGLQVINPDDLAREQGIDPYQAASLAQDKRQELFQKRESFVFETVFSDEQGDKLKFLREAEQAGYAVLLIFIGISSPEVSETRVTMRVLQQGHDVPHDKLFARYPRTMRNLATALRDLPMVLLYDNDDLTEPYRHVASSRSGVVRRESTPLPGWLVSVLQISQARLADEA